MIEIKKHLMPDRFFMCFVLVIVVVQLRQQQFWKMVFQNMATKFNNEQLLAIEARKDNILVAAGAGSGKSTVLVERLMRKIIGESIGIDQFLIVTFTNLAAREMAEKLRESLNDALAAEPGNQHLHDQLYRLPYAHISTFHGFCNKLLQRYYYLADLEPNMVLMDDLEAALLHQEVLAAFFEDRYEDDDFKLLVDVFGSDRSDEPLADLLSKIYEVARANPDMDEWLNGFGNLYDFGTTVDTWAFFNQIRQLVLVQIAAATGHIELAKELAISAQMDGVVHGYLELYGQDLALIEELTTTITNGSYEEIRNLILHTKPAPFPRIKKAHWDEELHQQANDARKEFLRIIDKLGEDFFAYSNESHILHFERCRVLVTALARVVRLFDNVFSARKKAESKLDFSDLERLTLAILTEHPDVLTEIATDFNEIMIDEYQDTNEMQERIVGLIAAAHKVPMFMVGDVKQSIYRFRLAEPGIFQAKYAKFQQVETNDLKIDLMQNYRSSKDVIDATNYIFARIMDAAVGEIAYDEAAALKLGVAEESFAFNQSELCVIDKTAVVGDNPELELLHDAELEAHLIAQKIVKMTVDSTIFDRKKGGERPLNYDDIVILLRSMTASTTFYEILASYGIPVAIETAGNLLEEPEIIAVLSALRIIDNPDQDIPLAAVMRSPLFFFSEPELAAIRIKAEPKSSFFDAVKAFGSTSSNNDLQLRVQDFLAKLNHWRYISKNTTLSLLLRKIYETTSYYQFVLGITGGELRRANLDLLVDIADGFETRTTHGLYGFLQHLELVTRTGKIIPKAKLPVATAGVKIMTIHKSKGLEFPVVFVSQLQKKFNTQDESGNYVIHKNFGVGLQYIDPVLRLKQKTLPITMIAKTMRNEMLAEEMRLLYVALTRAKSKLILIAVAKNEDTITKLATKEITLAHVRLAATRYLDWVLPVVAGKSPDNPWHWSVVSEIDVTLTNLKTTETDIKTPPATDFDAIFARKYPLEHLTTITAKQSVTQRKTEETVPLYHGIPERMETPAYDQPSFITTDTKATEIGTAFHQLMQHLPVTAGHTLATLTILKDDLVARHIIRTELANQVNLADIYRYTQSQLFQKMLNAKSVHKELPFTLMFDARMVEKEKAAKALLQGVVDLLVEFDDEVWIVDYKTDRVGNSAAEQNFLKRRYDIQMKYYLQAMREIFPQKRIIAKVYFMRVGEFVEYE